MREADATRRDSTNDEQVDAPVRSAMYLRPHDSIVARAAVVVAILHCQLFTNYGIRVSKAYPYVVL